MNLFHSSGTLDLTGPKPEPTRAEVTETKSIHSSEDELDREVIMGKLSSLPRRHKTRALANRKHNRDFRSVWYDDDGEEEEEEEDVAQESPEGRTLKKSTSLDNLLEVGVGRLRLRAPVTKNMISLPSRPRRIVGDWIFGRETERDSVDLEEVYAKRKMSGPIETASAAVEYFSKIQSGGGDQEQQGGENSDYVPPVTDASDTRSDKLSEVEGKDVEMITESVTDCLGPEIRTVEGKRQPVHSDDSEKEENVATRQPVPETDHSTSETNDCVTKEAEIVVEPSLSTLNAEIVEEEKEKPSESLPVLQLDLDNDEEDKREMPTTHREVSGTEEETVSKEQIPEVTTLPLTAENKGNGENVDTGPVDATSSFCTTKNFVNTPEAMELQTYNPAVFVPLRIVETAFAVGKETRFRKHGTVEGRGKLKKGGKLDISTPTLPRMRLVDGEEMDMSGLDSEGVTNLLRKSKSTNDLLKSFSPIKNEKSEQLNNPKFPISESEEGEVEDEVHIRKHQNINQYRYSKTTDFDFGRKWTSNNKDFEVRGLSKLFISSDTSPIKMKKGDTLRYQNGNFYRISDTSERILKTSVLLKSARLHSKRDVELRDSNNIAYILFFDSSKDAKLFLEHEKVRCYAENDNKSTITKTLLRLLGKRSSREMLEKKGIYQNEPIFGNTLRNIYNAEKGVPQFILRTMELIERPENITSLGIYRTSGNLATIQKIRFEVDKGRLSVLSEYCKDADVLTGCLKLFFRELKEPLIPCEVCDSLLRVTKADKKYSKSDRSYIRQIITKLPEANLETLYVLIKHLIEVVRYKDENKMDTYNLSVCWGPTIIFVADPTPAALMKDPVAQTADAARVFDFLLTYYIDHAEELDFGRKIQDHLDTNRNPIQRQDSRESIASVDSTASKCLKKTGSNQSLNVDEVLRKSVELIETNINSEGLYKKSGSTEKINKIVKKMMRKKVGELDRHRFDTNELTDSLKKYLREMQEPLVTQECVEQVLKFRDMGHCLEASNRQRIIATVEALPKKDTVVYLLRHIVRVTKHESQHNVSKTDIISIWTNVLNYQKKVVESNERFSKFLTAVLDVFDESKADVTPSPKALPNGLLDDLKNYQKDKDRVSKYDNVPEGEGHALREATIPEEKSEDVEFTKL